MDVTESYVSFNKGTIIFPINDILAFLDNHWEGHFITTGTNENTSCIIQPVDIRLGLGGSSYVSKDVVLPDHFRFQHLS